MRLYKWELIKLISAPAMWIFLALCIAFNIVIMMSESYGAADASALSRELARTGETRYAGVDDIFGRYDTKYLGDVFVREFKLRGGAETLMRQKYQKLQASVDRNAETGFGLDIYAGEYTGDYVHRTLFKSAIFLLFTEAALFALLAALYTLGYEHLQKTELIVYASGTGRKITRHKRAVALTVAAGGFILLAALTLAVYFTIWDYSGFWRASVQSANNYLFDEAGKRPFITWANLNVAQYLAAVLTLGFALTVVFSLVGSFAGLLTRNTYMGFILVLLICVAVITAIVFCANAGFGWAMFALLFSPVAAWISSSRWLTDMGSWGVVPYHETVTIALNLLLFSALTILAARRFTRKDVQ